MKATPTRVLYPLEIFFYLKDIEHLVIFTQERRTEEGGSGDVFPLKGPRLCRKPLPWQRGGEGRVMTRSHGVLVFEGTVF